MRANNEINDYMYRKSTILNSSNVYRGFRGGNYILSSSTPAKAMKKPKKVLKGVGKVLLVCIIILLAVFLKSEFSTHAELIPQSGALSVNTLSTSGVETNDNFITATFNKIVSKFNTIKSKTSSNSKSTPVTATSNSGAISISSANPTENTPTTPAVDETPAPNPNDGVTLYDNIVVNPTPNTPAQPQTPAYSQKIMQDVIDDINDNGEARVMITSKPGATLNLNNDEFVQEIEVADINMVAGILKQKGLDKLAQSSDITRVEIDLPLVPSTLESIPLIKGDVVQNMNVNGVGINGTGQTICVVDTGVNYTHPELGGCTKTQFLGGNCKKVVNGTNIFMASNDPMDFNGHGTGIASLAAADGPNYKGIAPGAKILASMVTTPAGNGWTSRLAAGINWCRSVSTAYNVTTILTGLTTTTTRYNSASFCDSFSPTPSINSAVAQNITVYGASGNSADTTAISYPACASNVIGLAAVEDGTGTTTADKFWASSNRHSMLDLLAPGSIINVTTHTGMTASSGTSLAAAHAAGASILLDQYNKEKYGLALIPAQLNNIFKLTGKLITDSATNLTFPRIDLLRAVNYETFPPVVTSISPSNNNKNISSVTPVTFSYSVTDHHNINNCSLYINSQLNQTSTNVPKGSTQTFSLSNLNPGNYNWQIQCIDNATIPNQGNSSTWLYKVNYPPVLSLVPNQTIQINTVNNIADLSSYITDGDAADTPTISIVSENTSEVNCGVSGLNLTMTPATNYIGSASCTILVNDGLENSSSQVVNIKVIPLNAAPNITSTPTTTASVGSLYSYNVVATDAENNTLTYSLITSPTGMTINSATGVVSWTPVSGQQGGNSVVVKVSDLGGFTTQSFTVTVSNSLPVITTTAPISSSVGAVYSYDVNATDTDLDTLTYSLTTSPTGMSINSATGAISWTPVSGQQGGNSVVVSVSDGFNAATQSFTINVANAAPVLGFINNINVNETQLVSITPSATDADNDTLSYTFTTPLNSSGQWQTDYYSAGTYVVTVTVNDGNGGSDSQNVTITVNDVLVTDIASQYFLKQIPASPQSNTFTTFGFMVTNIGSIGVNNVTWLLDSNSSDTNVNGTIPFISINSSQLVMAKLNYASPGNYTPKITLDYTLSIPETNESNNVATTLVTVA